MYDIEDIFRQGESEMNADVSPAMWHRLEDKLDKRKYKKRSKVYRSLMIAASMMLLVSSIGWYWQGKKSLYLVELGNHHYETDDLVNSINLPVHYIKDIAILNKLHETDL